MSALLQSHCSKIFRLYWRCISYIDWLLQICNVGQTYVVEWEVQHFTAEMLWCRSKQVFKLENSNKVQVLSIFKIVPSKLYSIGKGPVSRKTIQAICPWQQRWVAHHQRSSFSTVRMSQASVYQEPINPSPSSAFQQARSQYPSLISFRRLWQVVDLSFFGLVCTFDVVSFFYLQKLQSMQLPSYLNTYDDAHVYAQNLHFHFMDWKCLLIPITEKMHFYYLDIGLSQIFWYQHLCFHFSWD